MVGGDDNAYELALASVHGRIWDRQPKVTRGGVLVRILNSHRRESDPLPVSFQAVAFSGDGHTCAAADKRGHVYIFYLQLNRFSLISRDPPGPLLGALCFTQRRHEEVLVAAKTVVRAFDVDTHRNTAELRGHRREVTKVCSSGLAGLVLTQSSDRSMLWDVKDWSKKRALKAKVSPMCGACFTPLGDLLCILFRDSRIVLWRTSTMAFERELLVPTCADDRELMLRHVAASTKHIVSGGTGGLMLVWSLARDEPPKAIEVSRPISQLQLIGLGERPQQSCAADTTKSEGATVVAALQDDGVLLVALLRTLRVVLTVDLRFRALVAFEISSLSKYLVTVISDGCLEFCDVAKAMEYERKGVQQRIQLGAPEHLMQKVLKYRTDPWKIDGEPQHRTRRHRRDGDDESGGEVPKEGMMPIFASPSLHDAHPVGARRSNRRSLAQPQQRGANGTSKVSRGETAARSRLYGEGVAKHENLASSSRWGKAPTWHSWDPPLLQKALGPSSRSSSSHSSGPAANLEASLNVTSAQKHPEPDFGLRPDPNSVRLDPVGALTDADNVSVPPASRKFRELLRKRGSYPNESRSEIWRQLLQLPYNQAAYQSLEAAGIHPRFQTLHETYPSHTQTTIHRLARLLSAIALWSHSWADVPYLPAIAFPFLKIFGNDPILTFEIVVSVLLNWARGWLDELPGPPLRVLAKLDDLFVAMDPLLHAHLRVACEAPGIARSGAVHLAILWPLLQSLLTEVLPKSQWLQLWDHLLTHWLEPELLLAAVCAFLKCCRASLLELPAHAPRAVEEWLRRHQKVHMPALIETMYALQAEAAVTALPIPTAVDPVLDAGPLGEIPLTGTGPQLPLPAGRYPTISVYPHVLTSVRPTPPTAERLNSQHQHKEPWEHGKTAAHLSAHREQLLEIRTAVQQLTEEDSRFRQQQDELLKAEEARRKLAAEEEERLFEERRRADEEVIQRRLHEVRNMYEGVEKSLQQQRQLRTAEGQQLIEDLRRRHRDRAYEVESRMKEEAILNLEHRGMQTISELLLKRRDEESSRALHTHVKQRRREQELLDDVQRQAWRIEDEREQARAVAAHEQRVRTDQRESELRQRREVEMELRLEELERQLQLAQVARERVVRRTQQDADFMTEVSDNMQRRRHELAARAEHRDQAMAIAEERRFQRARLEERQRLAEREATQWRLDMEVRGENLSNLVADQARKDYEARSLQLQQQDADRDAQGEEVLKAALRQVEAAKRQEEDRELATGGNLEFRLPDGGLGENVGWNRPSPSPRSVGSPAPRGSAFPQASATGLAPGQSASFGIAKGASDQRLDQPDDAGKLEGLQGVAGLREQQLEDLIRRREAELEALWKDFDREARELSEGDDDKAVFLGVAPPSTDENGTPPTFAAARSPPRRSTHSRPRGGPLAGAWGDTSEESSDAEAFRRLGSLPPGTVAPPSHDFQPSRRRKGEKGVTEDHARGASVFDDKAWASESELS